MESMMIMLVFVMNRVRKAKICVVQEKKNIIIELSFLNPFQTPRRYPLYFGRPCNT